MFKQPNDVPAPLPVPNRFRRRYASDCNERLPLQVSHRHQPSAIEKDYSTFHQSPQQIHDDWKVWDCLFQMNMLVPSSSKTLHLSQLQPWKLLFAFLVCILGTLYHLQSDTSVMGSKSEWKWDHNTYIPRLSPAFISNEKNKSQQVGVIPQQAMARNLLLTQVAGGGMLNQLAAISSLPNRAYARAWGRDYALYSGSTDPITKGCFDNVDVLNNIVEKQTQGRPGLQPPYDAIAIFPPDAIVTNLDYDLLDIMPEDKLVAMAGRRKSLQPESPSEVLFFNLHHEHVATVSKLWFDMIQDKSVTCSAGNDTALLLSAIESVLDANQSIDSLIFSLDETDTGFIGKGTFAIKGTVPMAMASKKVALLSNSEETTWTVQSTVDSVCFRYFPKCDVIY
jgi:hypothetical protein